MAAAALRKTNVWKIVLFTFFRQFNAPMEQSKPESQHLFRRLLVYHCFRDSKSASEAASLLNQIYHYTDDDEFVSLQTVEALYGRFKAQSFNFDHLCQPEISKKRGRPPRAAKSTEKVKLPQTTEEAASKAKEAAEAVRQRPFLPREASKAKQPKPPPPTPKGRARDGKVSMTITKETTKEPATAAVPQTDPKFQLPKAVAEQGGSKTTTKPETSFDDTIAATAAADATDGLGNLDNMSGHKRRNLRRRQLYLHCFQAKYNTSEAVKYLCSVYGAGFTSKSSVSGWYRKFKRSDFSLDDGKRTGRLRTVDREELAAYMAAHPDSTVTQLGEIYKVHRKTILKWLNAIGYRFVVDRWEKLPETVEPLTDQQLCEYRLKHPQATVRDVAEHFLVNRAVVARRLRALGFDIPKWPVYAVKRYNSGERRWEYRPSGRHVQPGENVRRRTYGEVKERRRKKKMEEATVSTESTDSGENGVTGAELPFLVQPITSAEEQSSFVCGESSLNLLQPSSSSFGSFGQQIEQRANIIVGPEATGGELQASTTYIQQTNGQLPFTCHGYDSSFAQQLGFDSAQVQSLLHPYYM